MMTQLRPYQRLAPYHLRKCLEDGVQRQYVDLPIGTGKSTIAAAFTVQQQRRVLGLVHRQDLALQLADPDDLGLLHFEETGEMPEGMDFAVIWNGVWREGRCYDSYPDRTFVTYWDTQRLPLCAGMQAHMPLYVLSTERLLELARAYVQELGYNPTQEGTILGTGTAIASGERTQVAVPVGNERLPVVITVNLSSSGDIRLTADTETFLTPDSEDIVG